jgi:hypothetical protein
MWSLEVVASWTWRFLLLTGVAALPLLTACGSDSRPVPPATQRVRIFLIARGDGGRNGILLPCDDSAVPVSVMLPAEEPPLEGALRVLLDLDQPTLRGTSLMHPLIHSRLSVVAVQTEEGRARIDLTGQLRAGSWPCNRERIRAQLEQTVLQFEEIRQVELFVDGRPLAELLETSRGAPIAEAPEPSSAIPGAETEPRQGPSRPLRQR